MDASAHWETIYRTKDPTQVSWYQPHPQRSLQLIRSSGVDAAGAIIDVGGGASTLVDDLLAAGYRHLTVLDLSPTALAAARQRLGASADGIQWVAADITQAELPPAGFDVWHDRAVFHFLTAPRARERYVAAALAALKPGGQLVIATFALDGPEQCSGLPIVRYDAPALSAALGPGFALAETAFEAHRTPSGTEQRFIYGRFRKL